MCFLSFMKLAKVPQQKNIQYKVVNSQSRIDFEQRGVYTLLQLQWAADFLLLTLNEQTKTKLNVERVKKNVEIIF